jgi:hypothetical protein
MQNIGDLVDAVTDADKPAASDYGNEYVRRLMRFRVCVAFRACPERVSRSTRGRPGEVQHPVNRIITC